MQGKESRREGGKGATAAVELYSLTSGTAKWSGVTFSFHTTTDNAVL